MTFCTRSNLATSLLIATSVLMGCSQGVAPHSPVGQATGDGAAAVPPAPELMMVVAMQKGSRDQYETESIERFPDPTAAQIEEQVRALDWKDPQRWPTVGLGRTAEESKLQLTGLLDASSADETLRAKWVSIEDGKYTVRLSPPLESLDAALNLGLAYHGKDPNLKSMTEWTV